MSALSTDFGNGPGVMGLKIETEVHRGAENKALHLGLARTKVTSRFGPAGANIRIDCVMMSSSEF
jgi:hypothetical protein